jgi:hypothetical protein
MIREVSITEQRQYRWHKEYGGMGNWPAGRAAAPPAEVMSVCARWSRTCTSPVAYWPIDDPTTAQSSSLQQSENGKSNRCQDGLHQASLTLGGQLYRELWYPASVPSYSTDKFFIFSKKNKFWSNSGANITSLSGRVLSLRTGRSSQNLSFEKIKHSFWTNNQYETVHRNLTLAWIRRYPGDEVLRVFKSEHVGVR